MYRNDVLTKHFRTVYVSKIFDQFACNSLKDIVIKTAKCMQFSEGYSYQDSEGSNPNESLSDCMGK